MSNLPPGCSPNDPHIVGYPERTVKKVCGAEGISLSVVDPWIIDRAKQLLDEINFDVAKGRDNSTTMTLSNYRARNLYHLLLEISKQDFQADGCCPFEGEVDTQYDYYSEWWTCPLCGTEHEDPSLDEDWRD